MSVSSPSTNLPSGSVSTHSKIKLASLGHNATKDIETSAKEFEAVFIAQVLKDAGFDKAVSQGLGGAAQNYGSFILQAYAQHLVDAGGFGVASMIEAQLKNQEQDL